LLAGWCVTGQEALHEPIGVKEGAFDAQSSQV
jgi:hypothetical protein